jgi:hypothetical protein
MAGGEVRGEGTDGREGTDGWRRNGRVGKERAEEGIDGLGRKGRMMGKEGWRRNHGKGGMERVKKDREETEE